MKSPLFETKTRKTIERKLLNILNEQADFLSEDTAGSTRAAGDAIQSIIEDNFAEILRKFEKVKEFWLSKPEG